MLIHQMLRAVSCVQAVQDRLTIGLVFLTLGTMWTGVEAKQANAGSFAAIMKQASLMRQQRRQSEALKLYRQAIRLKPTDSEAHAKLGWTLFELKRVDEAMQEELYAIKLNPNNANAYHHLGAIYLTLNMWNEAADQFRMSLSLDPHKHCNCGPIESLLMTHPPGGAVMTPQEADRILGISASPKLDAK